MTEQVPAKKIIVLVLLIVVLCAVWWWNYSSVELALYGPPPPPPDTRPHPYAPTNITNTLFIGESAKVHGSVSIRLNPPVKFNFLTKHNIFGMRTRAVVQHPELTGTNYHPSESVFGRVEDYKPWWGLYGIYFYGPGQKGIEGPSEESRFFLNPFLLIGVREPNAYIRSGIPEQFSKYYPEPVKLNWRSDHRTAIVKYDMSGFSKYLDSFYIYLTSHYQNVSPEWKKLNVELVAYNARDFGFNYLWIDPGLSANIDPPDKSKNPIGLAQFIHCGGSCGYPGGCNNMSPTQTQLFILVPALPAKAYIKLWRQAPKDVEQKPDFSFIIDMI